MRHRIEQTLRRVDVPLLLIRGERDPIAPQRWLTELAKERVGTTVATVPGAAHNVVTAAGPQVAARTLGFTPPT